MIIWLLGLALDHPDNPTTYLKVSADPGRLAGRPRPPAAVSAPTLSIIVLILALIALVAMASLPDYTKWGA